MSVVTEHLEQQGSVFEVIPHRQVYTSTDEARALGIDADEVLKPLAMRTGSGYALMVIPASRRLDLQLARSGAGRQPGPLGHRGRARPRLRRLPTGALPPLGVLLGAKVHVDPEVLGHDMVVFAAGTQTESIRMRSQELFGGERARTVPLVKRPERTSDDPIA